MANKELVITIPVTFTEKEIKDICMTITRRYSSTVGEELFQLVKTDKNVFDKLVKELNEIDYKSNIIEWPEDNLGDFIPED